MKMLYFSKSYIQKNLALYLVNESSEFTELITNLSNFTELDEENQTFRIFDRI